ncbi:MAG TPA: hypothetical protein VEQ59_20595, partial [Polyangiaceae bacterium]|nr:hypothetical protein [Polyangiaceae bacterium]
TGAAKIGGAATAAAHLAEATVSVLGTAASRELDRRRSTFCSARAVVERLASEAWKEAFFGDGELDSGAYPPAC